MLKTRPMLPALLAGAFVLVAGACTRPHEAPPAPAPAASTHASSAPTVAPSGLRLERVVMLMRHGVRPPTKPQVTPPRTNDQPWPKWTTDFGELTTHGYDAVRLLGEWDRANWAARGLLPAAGCPAVADVDVAASSKSRTQATARALLEGLAPGCHIDVSFPADKHDDVKFHLLETGAMAIDADEGMRAVEAVMPAGGMAVTAPQVSVAP